MTTQGTPTTARQGRVRSTRRPTTAPSCATRTATASRRCTTASRARARTGSTISGSASATSPSPGSSTRRSRRRCGLRVHDVRRAPLPRHERRPLFALCQDKPRDGERPPRVSCADRATVEAFHRAALEAGFRDNGAPGERRTTTWATTAPSCSTPTATTSKRSSTTAPPPSSEGRAGRRGAGVNAELCVHVVQGRLRTVPGGNPEPRCDLAVRAGLRRPARASTPRALSAWAAPAAPTAAISCSASASSQALPRLRRLV